MNTISVPSATVPFKVPNLFGGLAESAGIAKATPSELILEFVVKETVFNVLKTNAKEIRIPRSGIGSIRLKQGLFKDKLIIRVNTLALLENVPGCNNSDLTLKVARRDRNQAGDVVLLLGGPPPQ